MDIKLVGDIVECNGVRVAWLMPVNSCEEARKFRSYIERRDTSADDMNEGQFGEIIAGIKMELDMLSASIETFKKDLSEDVLRKISTRVNQIKNYMGE